MKLNRAKEQTFSYEETLSFLEGNLNDPSQIIETIPQKHKLILTSRDREIKQELRIPLPLPPLPEDSQELKAYLENLGEDLPNYMIVLIQAGATALGYFEEGEVVDHKAIKKYMKRHKRGKAQITYLNKKGKSKAGSRIRLANTITFFEDINQRLTEWEEEYEVERIIYSCSPTLWGMMHQSKIPPPFEKKDSRLIKVPTNVHIPSYEELLRINGFVTASVLSELE